MEIKEFLLNKRRDFNIMLSLSGVIPFLVFVYLLTVKVSSLEIFIGEVGYIMFIAIVIFLLSIIIGRRMLISMVQELVEKNRLAAIAQTTLTLSHEINNPLLTIKGNLELLEREFAQSRAWEAIRNRLATIKIHCERIEEVTDKMANLSKAVPETIYGNTKIIDLNKSK